MMEVELQKIEAELSSLTDCLFNIKCGILNANEKSPIDVVYRVDNTGNLPEHTVVHIMETCKKIYFFARKMIKLIHGVAFERFMIRLLKQAYAQDVEDSDSDMDNYAESIQSTVDVPANLSLIGSGAGCFTLPSNFNLQKDMNVFNCDQIVEEYTKFISTEASSADTVKNGRMAPYYRLQKMMNWPFTVETVSQQSPTNNAEHFIKRINEWGDYIHNELFRSMRTIPKDYGVTFDD